MRSSIALTFGYLRTELRRSKEVLNIWNWLTGKQANSLVTNPKILVCSVGEGFSALLETDAAVYAGYYGWVQSLTLRTVDSLLATISEGFDVLHLFVRVSHDGFAEGVDGKSISGTDLIRHCYQSGIRLLWIASENPFEGYLARFKPGRGTINLVMTMNRRQDDFKIFLSGVLSRMAAGETMPVAWEKLAPQIPGHPQPNTPECIFSAGLGGVRLVR